MGDTPQLRDAAEPLVTFGRQLKLRRKALDLTQGDLAGAIGCALITVQKLEAGERRASKQIAHKLANVLGLPDAERAAFLAAARGLQPPPQAPPAAWPPTLPVPPTPLLGRDRAVAAIGAELQAAEARMLTLTGPPGVGKTRLAIATAAEMASLFADGVVWVALAAIQTAELVLPTIAGALGVREASPSVQQQLVTWLGPRRLLLVLDNFEHVVDAAPWLAELLAACPRLALLVTSRVALHLRGERVVPVAPLAVPPPDSEPTVAIASVYSAVELFVARAHAVVPAWTLTAHNVATVAAICRRLDGLPLALELAAARLNVLTPEDLRERLAHQLLLLTDGARDLPERQQTLRRAIAWSYALLPAAAQSMLHHLAVCRGGGTLPAIAALLERDEHDPALVEALGVLIDHNLVQAADRDGARRFTLLASIQEYALEQTPTHSVDVQTRHTRYYLALAEQAAPQLKGAQQAAWLARLADEHDNFRAALHRSWHSGDAHTGLRLAGALAWFWYVRGHLGEGRGWLERLLALDTAQVPPAVHAPVLRGLALLYYAQGEYAVARVHYQHSLAYYRALGDEHGVAMVHNNLGLVAYQQRDFDAARAYFASCLDYWRAAGDTAGIGSTQHNLGLVATEEQAYDSAIACYTESLSCFRADSNWRGVAGSLGNLGDLALLQGDQRGAWGYYTESLTLYRSLGDQLNLAIALENLAALALAQPSAAGSRRAALLYSAAQQLRTTIGAPLGLEDAREQQERITGIRDRLGEATFATTWTQGRALPLQRAISYALSELPEPEPVEQMPDA